MKRVIGALACCIVFSCSGMSSLSFKDIQFTQEQTQQETYSESDRLLMDSALQNAPPKVHAIIHRLNHPEIFSNQSLKALLLIGVPGTGKSLLARAFARAIKSQCEFISAPSLLKEHRNATGVALSRLIELLVQKNIKITLVLDEMDRLSANFGSEHTDTADTAAVLWTKLDELQNNENFFLIGTTNNAKKMPPQLQSRFRGARIEIPLPSLDTRIKIFNFYLKNVKNIHIDATCDDEYLKDLAKRTEHYSVRDITLLVNEAITWFAMANRESSEITLSKELIEQAFESLEQEREAFDDPNAHLTDEERRHQESLSQSKKFHEEQVKLTKEGFERQRELATDQMSLQWRLAQYQEEVQKKMFRRQVAFQRRMAQEQQDFQRSENNRSHWINAGIQGASIVGSKLLEKGSDPAVQVAIGGAALSGFMGATTPPIATLGVGAAASCPPLLAIALTGSAIYGIKCAIQKALEQSKPNSNANAN